MASIFAHGLTAFAFSKSFKNDLYSIKLWSLGVICAILPDVDVLGFKFGIAYGDFWGHRGFTHSLLFACILSLLICFLFYRKKMKAYQGVFLFIYFFSCTASHGVLDAMTTGGLGIAFLSPFDTTRYFFPFRPIQVSPIGASRFFSQWGLKVILSELIWVGIPALGYIMITYLVHNSFKSKN
ncbi:metal-dependent hydrolase [Aquimarina brevivitae]|uniref:Inner membrane protein n=1 Tax=Aquimarina brevivitae TaxID=323412 RepID=A0A4Q7NYP1_9FLAO|nr:metal-dependent hydrolase [Aquimarina brevivitae]RZS92566.1 inner membrane protein [Aquimarina brevivitae]